jgi:proteasome lid subunit RPN8/RPN11
MADRPDPTTVTWSTPECPFSIECSSRVLDDIRLSANDAFFSLPRGGAEIGGILLGAWREGQLTISDCAALDCEHAMGPSFTLSLKDEARMQELIQAAMAAGGLPVGWYHSHTRTGVMLSDSDLTIHNRFFPQSWQVALVVKPHTLEPMRCGFFFRGSGGIIHSSASYKEFLIDPVPMHQVPRAVVVEMPAQPPAAGPIVDLRAEPDPPPPTAPIVEIHAEPEPPPVVPIVEIHAEPEPPPVVPIVEIHAEPEPPPIAPVVGIHAEPEPEPIAPVVGIHAEPEPEPIAPFVEVHAEMEPDPEPEPEPQPRESEVEPEPAPRAAPPVPAPVRLPSMFEPPSETAPGKSRGWLKMLLAVVLAAGLGAGVMFFAVRDAWHAAPAPPRPAAPAPAPTPAPAPAPTPVPVPVKIVDPAATIGLNTVDAAGQLQIRWDATSTPVRSATTASLEIGDGDSPRRVVPLAVPQLASGVFTYQRRNERVDLTLVLGQPHGTSLRQATSFLGPKPPAPPAPPKPAAPAPPPNNRERDEAVRVAAGWRSQLEAERERSRQLEKDLATARAQLRQQQLRRLANQAPGR